MPITPAWFVNGTVAIQFNTVATMFDGSTHDIVVPNVALPQFTVNVGFSALPGHLYLRCVDETWLHVPDPDVNMPTLTSDGYHAN